MFEGLAGDVAFQAAHDLGGAHAFGPAPSHIGPGLLVAGHAGQHDAVQSGVGLTVSSPVEPPAGDLAGGGGEGGDTAQVGPGAFGAEPVGVVAEPD